MSDGRAERVRDFHAAQRKRGLLTKALRVESKLPLPTDSTPPFPGWAYLRIERSEKELHAKLKEHGGRWMREIRLWRIRADRIAKLELEDRRVPDPTI